MRFVSPLSRATLAVLQCKSHVGCPVSFEPSFLVTTICVMTQLGCSSAPSLFQSASIVQMSRPGMTTSPSAVFRRRDPYSSRSVPTPEPRTTPNSASLIVPESVSPPRRVIVPVKSPTASCARAGTLKARTSPPTMTTVPHNCRFTSVTSLCRAWRLDGEFCVVCDCGTSRSASRGRALESAPTSCTASRQGCRSYGG